MRNRADRASLKYLRPLLSYMKDHRLMLAAAIILAMASTIFTIVGPTLISRIANLIENGLDGSAIDMPAVLRLCFTLTGIYVTAFVFAYIQNLLMTVITQRTAYGLRTKLAHKINIMPLRYFDSTSIGDVLSRVTNDVDVIGMTLTQSVGNLFHAGTQFIGVLLIMFLINWQLTLVCIGAALIGLLVLVTIMKHSQKYFVRQQVELGKLNGHVEEIYSGQHIVRVYNGEEEELRKFDDVNNRLFSAAWRAQFLSGTMMPIMAFVGNLGFVAVSIVGSVMALNGTIRFGIVVAFMIYVRFFTNPLQQLGQVFTQLQQAAAASKRIFEFLEEEEMEDDSEKEQQIKEGEAKGDIAFSHVRFGYEPDRTIIKDFTAQAKAGQKIAIVGPTGAGKTTMVNLLMRFYEIDSGSITIDGINTKDMSRREIHDLFGMVLQDTWLFEGPIRDNIKYSVDASEEEIVRAAKMAGIHHFIKTLPQGYDTILDEEANVSQGQRQLITIARAMVEDAPFLILDEATSSVDTRTEVLIQEAMDKLMKGRTSFIIAHRLSTIRNADLILVMNNGDIIEQGSHDELIAKGGFYAELYNSQFDKID